jgi:hypothetical protein
MASGEILVEIAKHLRSAADRLTSGASRTEGHVTRVLVCMEGLLGGLPLEGKDSSKAPVEHRERADALARQHLGAAGLAGQVRWGIREAVSAAEGWTPDRGGAASSARMRACAIIEAQELM